ncbi:HU family DNA-binding protein [Sedimentitalea sp. XS_ASV28]|uniref:HU family DNA-binding protein n=1 Tax=Sedimentitalea sp. XS_ASV28 TaxID=3241296 RepID=UPI0035110683
MTVSNPTETGSASAEEMKKKELIDLAVARSGIKKKDAKPVVEAMLAILGEAIADGRELNLQPFGKLRVNRRIEKQNGSITICKLRRIANTKSEKTTGLAETPQDG